MKELSLNVLDIAMNSVKARASLIEITITETDDKMSISISDNGC
jgi:signal transduction histidine kinase